MKNALLQEPHILDESVYPNIYAFWFILEHGEDHQLNALRVGPNVTPEGLEDLANIDRELGAFSFNDVVRYATSTEEPGPNTLYKIHLALWAMLPQFTSVE
jgi:hypothetical protein